MGKVLDSSAGSRSSNGGEGKPMKIGSIPVRRLAAEFGTPLYALDMSIVAARAVYLKTLFPPPMFDLLYSLKANPSIAVMERLRALGFGCDACSAGDLEIARLAGCSAERISLTGVGLSREEIDLAQTQGVWLNIDSLSELQTFGELAPGTSVGLRVAPGVEAGFHPHCRSGHGGGKLGIDLAEMDEARAIARRNRSDIQVLHAHLGSGIADPAPYLRTANILLEVARGIDSVRRINIGGGFGLAYEEGDSCFPMVALAGRLRELLEKFRQETGRHITAMLEPGEYLVGGAGYLISTVEVIKKRRNGRNIAILDCSANLLPAALLYETEYPLSLECCCSGAADFGPDISSWDFYGRTNQGGDLLGCATGVLPLRVGDLVTFGMVGAYTSCRASQFNEIPRPAEVVVDGDTVRLSRHRETIQDLVGLQIGHGGETEELHDLTGVPPRARDANVVLSNSSAPEYFELRSFVDDAAIGGCVDLRGAGTKFEEEERYLVEAAWAVILAQHCLAEGIHVLPGVPEHVAERLEPLLQLLYDIRCACDRRPLVSAPRFPRGERPFSLRRYEGGSGTLVLFSGGADSTLLLQCLQKADSRLEALHFRVNPYVEGDEERAARELAQRMSIPLTVVDLRMPGFERVGRLHSRSYGIYPYYNSVPHGRDLLLATIGALIAAKKGFRRLAIGAEKDAFEHRFDYEGHQIHRADVVSEHGFFLLSRFLRECVAPDVELIAPLTGCSQYVCRRLMIERFPDLFALTQSCVWGRSCGMCLKCLSTYLVQQELRLPVKEFLQDMLNDPHNVDLESLVTFPGTPRDLGYENLYHFTLSRLARSDYAGRNSYWLRRFTQEKLPYIEEELPFLERACLELNLERVPADLRPVMARWTEEWLPTGQAVRV